MKKKKKQKLRLRFNKTQPYIASATNELLNLGRTPNSVSCWWVAAVLPVKNNKPGGVGGGIDVLVLVCWDPQQKPVSRLMVVVVVVVDTVSFMFIWYWIFYVHLLSLFLSISGR